MSCTLHLATRKGLFDIRRAASGTWSIESVHFLGANATNSLNDAASGVRYAALNHGHFGVKLHRSDDGGANWTEIATPAFPAVDVEREDPAAAPSVKEIWCLESAGRDRPDELWAGTIPGAMFHSSDRGNSWTLNESLWNLPERSQWFGGGKDESGIHSILVDPRDSRCLHVGVSCGGVWFSRDGGASWTCRATGMFAEYMPPDRRDDPTIQDPHRIARCAAEPDVLWCQHHNGIFVSRDAGQSWQTRNESVQPSSFGFAVCVSPVDPQTAWFVPGVKDECRVPVDGRLVVTRTRDGGESFEVLTDGLPQEHAYDIVYRHAFDISADGRRLAMASTTGNLWISEDAGDHWRLITSSLPLVHSLRFAESDA